jgi:signal transduction histidine kinase
MTDLWRLFPYPTLSDGSFSDGAILSAHPDCVKCRTRECLADEKARVGEVRQCRFGITYARLDEERVVNGVVASDAASPGPRHRRRYKEEPGRRVRGASIRAAIDSARALGPGVVSDYERSREEVLKNLATDPEMHKALAKQLRKDFEENLSQSHDFLQLAKLVRGHAESLLNDKHRGMSTMDAAERSPIEGAIYFSTELMLVKMDSLIYLHEINRALGSETRFQIHPFVLKYARIYKWQAEQKELSLRLEGECYAWCRYNNQAIGAVIQGLLDNLVKYAPAGSRAAIVFSEESSRVTLTFTSLGPRIEADERGKIFLPGYRARAAKRVEIGGMGVGLATAKEVSDALGLQLTVEQEQVEDPRYRDRYTTRFHLQLVKVP